MHGRRMVVGAAVAAILTLGATGVAEAHWDPDGDDHAMMGPGMMGGMMGPGMMDPDMMGPGMMSPGMMEPEMMEPEMMGPGMSPHPHEWLDD